MTTRDWRYADVARRLTDICGQRFARPAAAADQVVGATARWVAVPGTVEAVTAVLGVAAEHDLAVVARGAGTKIDWGATPARLDILLDTGRLAGMAHRPAGELVAEVGAGTPIRAVQTMLKQAGQRLPLDVPSMDATIGGVLAADEAGPLRHRHGTAGDQLLGVRYVDAAGVVTEAGGQPARESVGPESVGPESVGPESVGPESARRFCGSNGALGVLVSATFRVQSIPASQSWVSRAVRTPAQVHELVGAVLADPLVPAAIEVDLPAAGPGTLCVLLEGDPGEVTEQANRLITLLGGDTRASDVPPIWWRRYPFGPADVALLIDVPVAHLPAVIYALRDAVGVPVPVRGSAGVGVVHAALPDPQRPDRVAAIVDVLRVVLLAREGSCRVVTAPAPVRQAVDLWGGVPDLARLRQVKERFDPARRLAPGRYPGGL